MELIANRQLCLDEGTVAPGDSFWIADDDGREMMRNGLARERYATPYTKYEAKVVIPEVKPVTALPFRDVPAADAEPPALAALVAAVCAVSDAPEERNTRRIQRRKR